VVHPERLELYDLASDAAEQHDVSAEHQQVVQKLRAHYADLLRQSAPPKLKPKPAEFVSPKVWGEQEKVDGRQ